MSRTLLQLLPPSGFAFHKLRWNQYFLRPHRSLRRDPRNQELRRHDPDSAGSLINRGQGNRQHIGIMDIACTHDGNIVG